MENGYEIIRRGNFKKMSWSGGTIQELFIYPEKTVYEKRDFIFVLSTATVDVEESDFTVLDNFNRIILSLDNELNLTHNAQKKTTLKKYQPHLFYGGDNTKSQGKVNDYNFIMNRESCYGDVMCFSISKGSIVYPKKSSDSCEKILEVVYCTRGSLAFQKEGVNISINQGELLIIDQKAIGKDYIFSNIGLEPCDIILSTIKIK